MAKVRFSLSHSGAVLAAVLVIAIGAGVAASILLPHASITIHPKTVTRELEKTIRLSSKQQTPDYLRFILPATIGEKTVSLSKTFTREGGTVQDFSKGTVTFHNDQDQEQRLLPKTNIRTENGIFFLTDTPVTIPPKGTVSVGVTAKEKGPAGDVGPTSFIVDKLPPSLQELVYATSSASFSGGETIETPLTEGDIEKSKSEIMTQAKQQALTELTAQAKGAKLEEELVSVEVESENISASPGSKAASYTVAMNVRARGFFVHTQDIVSLMTLGLQAAVESDEEFISYESSSFHLHIARTDWKTGEAQIVSKLTGTYAKKIGQRELSKENLAGLSKQEVIHRFQASPTIGNVDVELSPFWIRSIPSRQNQIQIKVESAT